MHGNHEVRDIRNKSKAGQSISGIPNNGCQKMGSAKSTGIPNILTNKSHRLGACRDNGPSQISGNSRSFHLRISQFATSGENGLSHIDGDSASLTKESCGFGATEENGLSPISRNSDLFHPRISQSATTRENGLSQVERDSTAFKK
jgi:hypothetical protein